MSYGRWQDVHKILSARTSGFVADSGRRSTAAIAADAGTASAAGDGALLLRRVPARSGGHAVSSAK